MDVHQVTSNAVHDGPDDVTPADDFAQQYDYDGRDNGLEKQATAVSTASYQETYPEGGLQAWLVVVGSWFSLLSSLGLMNTIALFQAYVLTHQLKDYNEGTVGWIFSIYTFLAFFCGVFIGPVFDKYGPRWLVVAGSALTVIGVLAMSWCTELWHFILSFGVVAGIGTSLLFTPGIASVGHWFRARRGFATGIASTGGGIGGIVFPLMQTSLFEKIGYGWTVRVLSLICLVCCLVGIVFVRSRLPPAKNASAWPDFRIFRNIPFLLTTVGIFLLEFSLFIPLSYISTYAVHEGFSQEFAYQLLPIMNAGSFFGRILPGYYSDAVGAFNTCMFSVVLSFVSCLCVWLPSGHTTAGIIIFSVLFGFGSGTSIAIAPVCIGRLCKTQEYGRYYATAYTIVSFACLIGIPIGGNIIQANGGSYHGLIICTSAIYIASFISLLAAKATSLGWSSWLTIY
ncbi:unnamed protein product [Clonostachys rosea]|uniref:Major facilitator superfamily (MFS) profile domain-containing protein n=1 Tax=Bionectria ochroleuca TaxID=29856 RepID=A0ABY6UQC4_BIOOC|nr:unnamed protein product [Clonostachys rosea]